MPIQVTCPDCGRTMPVKDEFAGEKGLCPFCRAALVVPEHEAQPRARVELDDLEDDRRIDLDPDEVDQLQAINKAAPNRNDQHDKILGGIVLATIGVALCVGAVFMLNRMIIISGVMTLYGLPVLIVGIRNLILGSKMRVPRPRRVEASEWEDEDRPPRKKWSVTTMGKVVGGVFAMSVGGFFLMLGFLTGMQVVILYIEGAFFFLIGLIVALDGLFRPT